MNEVKSSFAMRGPRLLILDPGIVPQRPSFPNIPLNLTVAFILSLISSVGYLALNLLTSALMSRASRYSLDSEALR